MKLMLTEYGKETNTKGFNIMYVMIEILIWSIIFIIGFILSMIEIEIDLDSVFPSILIISNVTEYSPGESHFAFAAVESIIPIFSISQL